MEIVANGFGSPDVLKAVPTDDYAPKEGEVAISVRAAAVNHRDYKMYADRSYSMSHGQSAPAFPMRLGVEAAGTVTAVGPKAEGPAGPIIVGDEVIAYRIEGAYADRIVVAASNVVPKPSRLTWEQAGSMMLTGTTAAHTLAVVRARRGQTILIHAAAGGVGLAAVQLAALDVINVVGTASSKDFGTLRRYGAIPVAYGNGLIDRVREAAPQGIDAALDLVGTDAAIDVSLQLIGDRSRIVTIVASDRAKQDGFQSIGGSSGQDPGGIAIRNAARLRLTALVEADAFDVPAPQTFPLTQAADAHRLLAKGGGGGRIVLLP